MTVRGGIRQIELKLASFNALMTFICLVIGHRTTKQLAQLIIEICNNVLNITLQYTLLICSELDIHLEDQDCSSQLAVKKTFENGADKIP